MFLSLCQYSVMLYLDSRMPIIKEFCQILIQWLGRLLLSNKILLHLRSKPIISNFSGSIHRQRTGWQQNCACQQNCILADQVQGRASSSVYLGPPCPRRVVIQRQLYRSHRRIPGEILTFTSAGNTLAFVRAIFRAQFTECSWFGCWYVTALF